MRRKTNAGRALHQLRTVSVLKALRLTLSKVGNDLFALPLATLGATQETVELEDCAAAFIDDHLLILLDGPDGLRGAAMIDPALVGGLIQQQTMVKVHPIQDGVNRPMTGTDAALVAPLINAVLERAADLPETDEERAVLAGFQFGAQAADVRLLMLALEARSFHIIRMTVDMAKGVRQGELVLCLPVRELSDMPEEAESDPTKPARPPRLLAETVMSLPAELRVSLTQITLPIRQASGLKVGQSLDLGHVSFDTAQVRTREGRVVATGVLGQTDGMRAVRLKHRTKKRDAPQRRESDVDTLRVQGGYDAQFEASYALTALPDVPDVPNFPDTAGDPVPAGYAVETTEYLPDLSGPSSVDLETGLDFDDAGDEIASPSQYSVG